MPSSWLVAAAFAADPSPSVERGWALIRVGDALGAERVAAARLARDPADVAALRLHTRARALLDGDHAAVAEARQGLAADPRGAAPRLALVDALVESWRFDPAWCAEIDRLLGATPPDDPDRFWTHALRHRAATRRCKVERAPDAVDGERRAALALAPDVHGSAGVSFPLAASDGVDAAEAAWIEARLAADPDALGHAAALWEGPEAKGTARARKAALRLARAQASSDDVARLAAAHAVFEAAGASDPSARAEAQRAEQRLAALHPDPHRYGAARLLQRARHADPARALAQVDAVEVPADRPELVAAKNGARGELLWELGRAEEAVEALRAAWRATPGDGDRANAFAYRASAAGARLEEALEAATVAVQAARAQRFATRTWSGESWEAWRERTVDEVGSALDTRGWVLFQLGRVDEAVSDLEDAVRLVDAPIVHLHLGLALASLGEGDAAAPHLARGSEERDPGEQAAVARGREVLAAWWEGAGRWHPRGLDGWVADITRHAEPPTSVFDGNPLVGRELPPHTVTVDGRPLDLASLEGPLVLDFWATWCRPCVESLPKVELLAERHADVRFIAVSVDRDAAAVERFFDQSPEPGFDVAWWSGRESPYEAFAMSGVPSLFVVGRDGKVASYLFGSDVNRLGEALEALDGSPRGSRSGAPGP